MDSLLSTVKSNWINWNTILAEKLPEFKYMAEKEDHYLTGKTTYRCSERSRFSQARLYYQLLAQMCWFFEYAKQISGQLHFQKFTSWKVNDLVIQARCSNKIFICQNWITLLGSLFGIWYISCSTNKPVPDFIFNWSVNHQVRKIYGTSSIGDPMKQSTQYTGQGDFMGNRIRTEHERLHQITGKWRKSSLSFYQVFSKS